MWDMWGRGSIGLPVRLILDQVRRGLRSGVHNVTMPEEPERRRNLTTAEADVLRDIRGFWGPQNTEADVFFTGNDEAVLFVKARDLSLPLCVVLTNLARWRADGSLSIWAYRRQIMGPTTGGLPEVFVRAVYWTSRVRALIRGWRRDA